MAYHDLLAFAQLNTPHPFDRLNPRKSRYEWLPHHRLIANRLQDLTLQYAKPGRTGNQALRDIRMQAMKEGITPSIYCHAVGYHGHAAGPPIGMTDFQEGVPVRGDDVFRPNTWHSIELNAKVKVPEWGGQEVQFALEEDAALLTDGTWSWVLRRQDRFHLIEAGNKM